MLRIAKCLPMPTSSSTLADLVRLLRGRRTVVLTGAGVSTESGIPDYRGPTTRGTARTPIRYHEFVERAEARTRYWSRSALGWPRIRTAEPNDGHRALALLEEAGRSSGVITQNVDGLHQAGGSRRVVELHGSLARVRCLDCGDDTSRAAVQERLLALNPSWRARSAELAPDGDADLPEGAVAAFTVPDCTRCGGVLKPDVVFFGETVPPDRVEAAWALYETADVLLVAGSSLTVYSGYRFVLRAAKDGVPVVIVNLGPTRGDAKAAHRLDGRTGHVLPRLAHALVHGYAFTPHTPTA